MVTILEEAIKLPIVKADLNLCQGYANCVMEAPEFFDIDDEGLVVILQEKFDEDKRAHVESAARSCPVSALRVEDE